MRRFAIRWTEGAKAELKTVRPHVARAVFEAVGQQLATQPNVTTKHRKQLENFSPVWAADGPVWQLSVGAYRVFYDVFDAEVVVRAIRYKGSKTTEEIR